MHSKVIVKTERKTTIVNVDKTIFVANDNKEFDNEQDCLKYENKLKLIEIGKYQFNELKHITEYQIDSILRLCFGATGSLTDEQLVLWKSTKNKEKLKEAIEYLIASGFNKIYEKDFEELDENKLYFIGSWTEDWFSDRPEYNRQIILNEDLFKSINELQQIFNSNLSI